MKKNYKEKLKMYSALAGSIALASSNDVEAQVVYHDVNPDTLVNTSNTSFDIDLNHDGIVDFTLHRYVGTYTYFRIGSSGNNIVDNNAITYGAKRLNSTDSISSSNNFANYIRLATAKISDNSYIWGNWHGGETDKYLGVQFKDASNNLYYGWIRLDMAADFSSITVKDFAYESSPGALIKAGATSSVPAVTSLTAIDGGNADNASDMHIGFLKASSETNITKYRAFVVPSAQSFDLATAQTQAVGTYYDIAKTGSNISAALPATLTDINTNAIVNFTDYKIYVMSVGASGYDDALATSSTITLYPSVAGATSVVAADIANNGNASDMQVTFTKSSSETDVLSYAVLIVPSSQVSGANLANAQAAVAAGNYTTVAKTGANLSVVLSPTAKDVSGTAIAQGTSYEAFVLTIATSTSNKGDSLSLGSAAVTLSGVTSITDASSITAGISAYENTLYLNSIPAEGNVSLLSATGEKVFSGKVVIGDNTFVLSNVNTGIYVVQLIMQDKAVSKKVFVSR